MFPFDDPSITAMLGGGGVGVTALLVVSKLRRVLVRDSVDVSAHKSMQQAMDGLREENSRLHEEVLKLRSEIDRLRTTVTNLTTNIAEMSAVMSRRAIEDQMAREGLLDRRKPHANRPE